MGHPTLRERINGQGAAPAQGRIQAPSRGDARLNGGGSEAPALQQSNVGRGCVGVGVQQVLPRPSGEQGVDAAAVAAHRGGGDHRPGRTKRAQPGLGQAPQGRAIMIARRLHGDAAPLTRRQTRPSGHALITRTEIGNECDGRGSGHRMTLLSCTGAGPWARTAHGSGRIEKLRA